VIGSEAARAVDRDRRRDPGLVEGERIEDRLGEDDLGRQPRGLEVQDAAQRAGQVAMPWRPEPAAVEVRPLAGKRVRDRHYHAAAEQLAPLGRDDAEGEQLFAELAAPRDHLQQ
jgi:hypothetical protein